MNNFDIEITMFNANQTAISIESRCPSKVMVDLGKQLFARSSTCCACVRTGFQISALRKMLDGLGSLPVCLVFKTERWEIPKASRLALASMERPCLNE